MQLVRLYEVALRKPVEYEVADSGCWHVVSHPKSCDGYIKVKRNAKAYLLHRWVYEQEKGSIPEGMVIMHSCDNPACINPDHLSTGTQGDNNADRHSKGRNGAAYGLRNGKGLLTIEQQLAIVADNRRHKDIASDYGIAISSVASVKQRYKGVSCSS